MSESTRTSVPLVLVAPEPGVGARRGEPVTVGVPLPRGLQQSPASWWVRGQRDLEIPSQVRVLDRWGDGSVRWALVDFQADADALPGAVELRFDGKPGRGPDGHPSIACSQDGADLLVRTGPRVFRFTPGGSGPFAAFDPGAPAEARTRVDVLLSEANGAGVPVTWRGASLEEEGVLRSCVRVCGTGRTGDGATLDLTLRCHLYAGSSVARLLLTVRNPRPAAHPGGHWELGDAGSVLLQDLSLVVVPPAAGAGIRCSTEPLLPLASSARRVHLHQDSSGGEHWQSSNHVNRDGVVPNAFRGYRVDLDETRSSGLRATPVVLLDDGRGSPGVGVAIPAFWENFPRVVEAEASRVRVGFWPREHASPHELQGGEQKTHECYLAFGPDSVTDVPLDWCRRRLVAHASPAWYAEAEAVAYLTPAGSDPNRAYVDLVNAAIEGDDSFFAKRERVDEYGWRHFGEIYGDHEAVYPVTPVSWPLVSHYNNQYDPVAGFACQFLRSGDLRWWSQCCELARHVADIDLYHTDRDKAAYNHGLFWHTVHYVDAGKATHRTYPRAKGSGGGGPASEQNYPSGLALHYLMTGDLAFREAAVGLAQFVIDMDDGRKTVFRWLAGGATGLASASRTPLYHGPGRGSGNSLNALVDGHRLTGDRRFLDKAEEIVRRCVHPDDDVEALNLLDAENRWFYTMFLQALAKYLDHKAQLGQLDEAYAYGRLALLRYARWMAAREYPFMDKPELLEYPTETWPAQDMRKCEVFQAAARHAAAAERRAFAERAAFFFDYVVRTLSGMPTRTLARPVVLLLSYGHSRAWFAAHPEASAPEPGATRVEFPRRVPFVPQKVTAMKRAKILLAAGALAGLAGAAALAAWWLR